MGNTRMNTDRNTRSNWDNTDGVRITAPVHDTFLEEVAGEGRAQPLSEVISEVVGGRMAGRLSRNQRAARAWFSVNGALERSHTCGVYLRKPRGREAGPVLVVYVDTGSRVTDFRTNKELYLARLANGGFDVSDLDFRLSHEGHSRSASTTSAHSPHDLAGGPVPTLTAEEQGRVECMTHPLPDGLRESSARAMCAALRRSKMQKTQSGT